MEAIQLIRKIIWLHKAALQEVLSTGTGAPRNYNSLVGLLGTFIKAQILRYAARRMYCQTWCFIFSKSAQLQDSYHSYHSYHSPYDAQTAHHRGQSRTYETNWV